MLRRIAFIATPLLAALAVAGVLALRQPAPLEPLEPLAVQTLHATAPDESWVTTSSEGTACPAFSLRAPVRAPVGGTGGQGLAFNLHGAPSGTGVTSGVNVVCTEVIPETSLAELTDWKRRHPDEAHLVGDPVIEQSAFGAAVRSDLRMNRGLDITEWAVERDGWTFVVGYLHSSGDASDRATVEAMLASWVWASGA